jgi:serine/threonine-protein kinase HipA
MAQDKPNWTASLGHDGTSPTAEDLRRHWDMPRALSIFSNAQRVGRLSERAGIWELQYDHTWMTSPEGWDLGPGLPRAAGTITDGASERPVQWFFDNLLPEEDMRTAVAKTASVDQADAFALLGYLGRESAGSLVLLPEGQEPEPGDGYQTLSLEELSARIRSMPTVPITATGPKRMSLAGAQQKLLVRWDGKTLTEPVGASPSTHILKPQSTSAEYPHSVINEYAMMRLAALMGLDVPPVWRLYVPQPVYIVQRFDRTFDGRAPGRLHVIDTCQLMNMPRAFKYEQASLPTLGAAIKMTRSRAQTRQHLWRWLLFNVLIGNHDNHLKNVSFVVTAEGSSIAPAYDLLSTAIYHTTDYALPPPWPGVEMAIPAPEAPTFADLTRERMLLSAAALGVPASIAARELDAMCAQILPRMDQVIAHIAEENGATPQEAKAYHAGELRLLRAIRHVVIQDMVERIK